MMNKKSLNNREQYARLLSIRIDNMSVDSSLVSEVGVDYACMITAYDKIIHPVLSSAVSSQNVKQGWKGKPRLKKVPEMLELLSNGHFLRSRNRFPTVIIRFRSRFYRNLFLRLRREFLPRPTASEVTASEKKFYSVRPDLTHANFRFLHQLRTDERVHSAWAFDCKLRFKLQADVDNNKTVIHETDDVFCTVSEVLTEVQTRIFSQSEACPPQDRKGSPTRPPFKWKNVVNRSRIKTRLQTKLVDTTEMDPAACSTASTTGSPAASPAASPATKPAAKPAAGSTTQGSATSPAASPTLQSRPAMLTAPAVAREDESRLPNSKDLKKTKFNVEFLSSLESM